MDNDLVDLKIAVGIMANQLSHLSKIVEKQSAELENLIALVNRGKGASWVLIGLGGVVGAIATKLMTLLPLIFK